MLFYLKQLINAFHEKMPVIGSYLVLVVSLIAIYQYIQEENIKEYNEPLIPLVDLDFNEFRNFLDDNNGETIKFKTSFNFSAATDINYKINELCGYFKFNAIPIGASRQINSFTFNIIKYRDSELNTELSCYDSIKLKMKDSTRLQFNYGGTGIVTLPFYGTFIIERRAITGSTTQYTLREI